MDPETVTTGEYEGEYPSDDCQDTWHIHENSSWAWGINCDDCHTAPDWHGYDGPNINIMHLKRQNAEGRTTAEEVREVLSNVKPEDREKITRAR